MYAMASLAVHDALNAIDRRSDFYAHPFRAPGWASVNAAVAAASHDSLIPGLRAVTGPFVPCLDAAFADVESFYADKVAAIPDGPAKTAGLNAGHQAAAAIVALRALDQTQTSPAANTARHPDRVDARPFRSRLPRPQAAE
jgi:hypothetical protein